MPELPEVETARSLIADQALHRRIVGVDDADTFVCRPHSPGELRDALTGRKLTSAHRRGKTMWCETSDVGRSTGSGPDLGIHLGMSGRIVVTSKGGEAIEGGGPARRDAQPRKAEWNRFTLEFADGGSLALFDKRRLGRVRLNPDIDALGPDAEEVTLAQFRDQVNNGRKVAIQILEFFDRHGVTLRRGDLRRTNRHRLDLFRPPADGAPVASDHGREASPVGRPDFKSGKGREPVLGGFDSHSLPPPSGSAR